MKLIWPQGLRSRPQIRDLSFGHQKLLTLAKHPRGSAQALCKLSHQSPQVPEGLQTSGWVEMLSHPGLCSAVSWLWAVGWLPDSPMNLPAYHTRVPDVSTPSLGTAVNPTLNTRQAVHHGLTEAF